MPKLECTWPGCKAGVKATKRLTFVFQDSKRRGASMVVCNGHSKDIKAWCSHNGAKAEEKKL